MKVRTLVQQDNDLPLGAENLIRVQELRHTHHVLLAHHVDLNLIDGSAIWFASMAEMLAATGAHVVCSISSEAESSPIVQPLLLLDNVTIVTPKKMGFTNFGRKLPHDDYISMVNRLANYLPGQTKVFSRGFDLVQDLSQLEGIEVWAYLTDYYRHDDDGSATVKESTASLVQTICENGGRVLCQTSLIQDELMHLSGLDEQQFVGLPPMIPRKSHTMVLDGLDEDTVKIVYAGKIAPLWGVEPLLDAASTEVAVRVIGDKIHNGPADDSTFRSRMTSKLESYEHIDWIHRLLAKKFSNMLRPPISLGASRCLFESQTRNSLQRCLNAFSWAPYSHRSILHEELLGWDYPFFVEGPNDLSWKKDLVSKLQKAQELLPGLEIKLEKHKITNVSREFSRWFGGGDSS